MRLSIFSKFWLLQFQKSIVCNVKTVTVVFPKRKYLVSTQVFTWAAGTLFGFISLFFSIKNALLHFDFNFRFNSKSFLYQTSFIFLDTGFYFTSKIVSWGINKDDIFLRAGVGKSFKEYSAFLSKLDFYFKYCTSYRFIDLLSRATMNNLPAFDVFWNCFISISSLSGKNRSLFSNYENNNLILKYSKPFLLSNYLI